MRLHRRPNAGRQIAAAIFGMGLVSASQLGAATFTYTRTTTGTDQWSAGTNWSAVPVSAADTTLTLGGAMTTRVSVTSSNDNAGTFTLNAMTLNFSQSGGASGSTIVASGNQLEFVANDTTAPVLTFDTASGAVKPNVTLSNNVLMSVDLSVVANSNATMSGLVSGAGGLTKSGAGTLYASGLVNTYTGPTVINAGTLRVNALANINTASSIGQGSVDGSAADLVFGGGTLAYSGGAATLTTNRLFTIGTAAGNGATLDAGPSGTLIFNGSGSIGLVNDAAHTLTLTSAVGPSANLGNRSKLSLNLGDYSAGSSTAVYKTGGGVWDVSGSNSYSGGTFIQDGMLQASSTTGFGTGLVTVSNTAMASAVGVGTYTNDFSIAGIGRNYNLSSVGSTGGAIRLGGGADLAGLITMTANSRISTGGSSGTATISGRITGAFSIEFGTGAAAGHATLVLSNSNNDYTGNTTFLSGGTNSGGDVGFRLGASEVLPHGTGKGNLVLQSSRSITLNLNGFSETVNGLVGTGSGSASTRTITNGTTIAAILTVGGNDANASYLGQITGGAALSLAKIGSGTQTLAGVGGSYSYTGSTAVRGGTLNLDFSQQAGTSATTVTNLLSTSSRLVLDGGRLRVTERASGQAYTEAGVVSAAATALTLTSTGGLVVGQTVTGTNIAANTYIQRISGNVLTLSANAIAGTGDVTVGAATFSTSQTLAALDLLSSSAIDFGTDGNSLVLTFNGLTHTEGAVLTIENWAGTPGTGGGADRLLFANSTTFSFSQSEVQFVGYGDGYTVVSGASYYEIVANAVPEPTSLSLLVMGGMGLLRRRRRPPGAERDVVQTS